MNSFPTDSSNLSCKKSKAWKLEMIMNSKRGLSHNKINNFSEIISRIYLDFSGATIIFWSLPNDNRISDNKIRKMSRFYCHGTPLRSGPGKPNQRKLRSWTFRRGIPEQKFNVNRACFPKEKHQNSQKWAKFMNFSFWPFLWFGLPGRLLIPQEKTAFLDRFP